MPDKPWLANYPDGIPAEIDPDRYESLAALIRASFARNGEARAFSNRGTTLTFAEADRLSRDFAAYLRNGLGLSPGDRIAVMLPNLLQSPVAIFGILRAGLVTVNVNPMYTPHELEHQLRDSGARAIIVLESFAGTVEAVLPSLPIETVIVTRIGDAFPLLKRVAVDLIVKYVKRLVPRFYVMFYDLCAIDERERTHRDGQPAGDFTLVYHLTSFERNTDIRVKVALAGDTPVVPTVTS